MTYTQHLRNRITEALERGETIASIARAAGVSRVTLSRFYSGRIDIRLSTASRIASGLLEKSLENPTPALDSGERVADDALDTEQ